MKLLLFFILFLVFDNFGQTSRNSFGIEGVLVFPKTVTRSWGYMGIELPVETSYTPSFAVTFMYNMKTNIGKRYYFNFTPGFIIGEKYYSGLLLGLNFQKYVYEMWFINLGFMCKLTLNGGRGNSYDNPEMIKPTMFFRLGKYINENIAININYTIPLDNIYGNSYQHGYGYKNDIAITRYLRSMFSIGVELTR